MFSKRSYLLIIFVLLAQLALSQVGGDPPGDPGGDPDPTPVPIHGAIYLLLAGALLGFKRIRNAFNRKG